MFDSWSEVTVHVLLVPDRILQPKSSIGETTGMLSPRRTKSQASISRHFWRNIWQVRFLGLVNTQRFDLFLAEVSLPGGRRQGDVL